MRIARLPAIIEYMLPTVFRRGTVLVGVLGTFFFWLSRAPAGPEPVAWIASSTRRAADANDDLELSLRARKLLLQDGQLTGQIGVNVRWRVAILWGTVPSTRAARYAEECLRNLPGLTAIRNELYVDTREGSEAGPNMPGRARLKGLGDQVQAPETRNLHGALVHRAEEQPRTLGPSSLWRPAGIERTEVLLPTEQPVDKKNLPEKSSAQCLPGFPIRDLAVRRPPIAPEKSIPVMPPIALPLASTAAGPAPAALSSTPMILRMDSGLPETIEALRLADERFRGVRVDVRGDTVYFGGTVYRWEHLFELARSVSRLPGVRRVLFEEVRAEFSLSDH